MLIVITGVPASGKSTIAKMLSEKTNLELYSIDYFTKEREIDLKKLFEKVKKIKKGILESHIFCEIPIKADLVFLIKADEKRLRQIMKERKYPELKIEENIFCNNTGYFENALKKNYKKFYTIENEDINKAIKEIIYLIRKNGNK